MTYREFMERFPDNDACVQYLKQRFYPDGSECPKCGKATKFHRIRSRAAYGCQFCGHQVYPTAGTIFHKSTTSLQMWFWAIYLMSSTRCGISAKQLERELGVTYKTAWRMFNKIRTLLSDDDSDPMTGAVEMDESYYGPARPRNEQGKQQRGRPRAGDPNKTPIFAMAQRQGRVIAKATENVRWATIFPYISKHVLPSAVVYTDEYMLYRPLERHGYRDHRRIYHAQKVYVMGDTHTQTIEGFFGLFKNGVRGVYHSVSRKHLQGYLDEYTFRYNRRDGREPIFWAILDRVQKPVEGPAQ
jgi:transposase